MTEQDAIDIISGLYESNKTCFPSNVYTVIVKFNDRLKSTLGRCSFQKMTIDGVGKRKVVLLEFNSTLLEYEEQMEDVIIHEFAHAIAGEKDIQEKFHSHLWKEIAIALGGTGDIKIKGL